MLDIANASKKLDEKGINALGKKECFALIESYNRIVFDIFHLKDETLQPTLYVLCNRLKCLRQRVNSLGGDMGFSIDIDSVLRA